MQGLISKWRGLHWFARIWWAIVAGGGGLLMSCFCLLMAVASVTPDAEPEAAQSSTQVAAAPASAPGEPEPPGATPIPSETAAPTEDPAPTETSAPTETPAPTDTAAPTATNAPPTVAPVPSVGLGRTRQEVQQVYQSQGFRFEVVPLANNQLRYMGEDPVSGVNIETIGPDENLIEASVIAGVPDNDSNVQTLAAIYTAGLFTQAAPDWSGGIDWYQEQLTLLTEARRAGEITYDGSTNIDGNRYAHLQALFVGDGMLLTITISADPEDRP